MNELSQKLKEFRELREKGEKELATEQAKIYLEQLNNISIYIYLCQQTTPKICHILLDDTLDSQTKVNKVTDLLFSISAQLMNPASIVETEELKGMRESWLKFNNIEEYTPNYANLLLQVRDSFVKISERLEQKIDELKQVIGSDISADAKVVKLKLMM